MGTMTEAGTIERSLVFLSERCDGANARDGEGFNGTDAHFGHELAAVVRAGRRLSYGQRTAAHKMLQKYAKQLSQGGIDIKMEKAPDASPPGVDARVAGPCAACGQRYEIGSRIRFLNDGTKRRIHVDCEIPDQEPDHGTGLNDPTSFDRAAETHLAAIRQESQRAHLAMGIEEARTDYVEGKPLDNFEAETERAPMVTRTGKSVRELLGPNGPVAAKLPGYEHREEQIACAEAIEQALYDGQHIAVEAGTGTGKSFMALVAIYNSGLKATVSTAVKSLQTQYWVKDVPFLKTVFPDLTAAIIKGRSNYLCERLFAKRTKDAAQLTIDGSSIWEQAESQRGWMELQDWRAATDTGDVESFEGMTPELRRELTVTSDLCTGAKCKYADKCWANIAHQRANAADIVIANHTLTLLDQAVRQSSAGAAHILPDADVIVIDEAHHLEDIATDTFGVELEQYGWNRLAELFEHLTIAHPAISIVGGGAEQRAAEWMQELALASETVRSAYQAVELRFAPDDRGRAPSVITLGDMNAHGRRVWATVKRLTQRMTDGTPFWLTEEDERDQWKKVAKSLRKHGSHMYGTLATETRDQGVQSELAEGLTADQQASQEEAQGAPDVEPEDEPEIDIPDNAWVRYAELNKFKKVTLHRKPIEVAPILRETLFDSQGRAAEQPEQGGDDWDGTETTHRISVVGMSATLAVGGNMGAWRARVGMDDGQEIVVASPFDYMTNGRLYIPHPSRGFQPKYEGAEGRRYDMQVADEMANLVEASGGRAFLLFTSNRQLQKVWNEIAWDLQEQGYQVLRQGMPGTSRESLIASFKERPSVLFGVATFWEGIDVQGDALSLVVIDKLPFPPQDDPIWEAREQLIRERGGNPFAELSVPYVVVKMNQGAGRLIRNKTDRGAVAILDARLRVKAYGQTVIKSLPPFRPSEQIEKIRALWPELQRPS